MFKRLGIPSHKMNLLIFRDLYNLEKSYGNFSIIYSFDKTIKKSYLEFNTGLISYQKHFNQVRKHLDVYYNLRLGYLLKRYLNKYLKRE